MTYALTQSFSHVSYGIGHAPLSHITAYVLLHALMWIWHTCDWHINVNVRRESVANSVVSQLIPLGCHLECISPESPAKELYYYLL